MIALVERQQKGGGRLKLPADGKWLNRHERALIACSRKDRSGEAAGRELPQGRSVGPVPSRRREGRIGRSDPVYAGSDTGSAIACRRAMVLFREALAQGLASGLLSGRGEEPVAFLVIDVVQQRTADVLELSSHFWSIGSSFSSLG